jgi:hypothetical protein
MASVNYRSKTISSLCEKQQLKLRSNLLNKMKEKIVTLHLKPSVKNIELANHH